MPWNFGGIGHRHDLLGELRPGQRDALVRAERERVLLLARDAVLLGQDLGRLAHVQTADGVRQAL